MGSNAVIAPLAFTVRPCRICNRSGTGHAITLRDGSNSELLRCESCGFAWQDQDPNAMLVANEMEQHRLADAGLGIPAIEEDFANGLRQSQEYVAEYLSGEPQARILEAGCSWGYFLSAAHDAGHDPYGIEINPVRRNHVMNNLGLPCYESIEEASRHHRDRHFDRIFLFYVMEYFVNPIADLRGLYDLLAPGGELIAITPNHEDALLSIWNNPAYNTFHYDACAVNYFSPSSFQEMASIACPDAGISVSTRQGYSIANHLNWQLHGKPMKTGCTGKDRVIEDLDAALRTQTTACRDTTTAESISNLLHEFDRRYRCLLETAGCGNQIHLRLKRAC